MITVGIVEDDAVVRNSLARLIHESPGFRCLAACASAEDALQKLPETKPQVVLMDVNLPQMSGIHCTRKLRQILPHTQILMHTVYEDSQSLFQALRAGACGYLLKRTDPEQVLAAIKDILEGGAPMSSEIARKMVTAFHPPLAQPACEAELTEREAGILALLAKGYANKEIADYLGVSVATVRTHLRHIYEKLHVRSRTEAVGKVLG
jgi:DNA-binding NarL/FixJ family response regulator